MIRGVLSGVFWGLVSLVVVAASASLLTPLPGARGPAPEAATAPASGQPVAPPASSAPEAPEASAPEPAGAEPEETEAAVTEAPTAPPPVVAALPEPRPEPAPPAETAAPDQGPQPTPGTAPAVLPGPDALAAPAPAAAPPTAPVAEAVPGAAEAPGLPAQAQTAPEPAPPAPQSPPAPALPRPDAATAPTLPAVPPAVAGADPAPRGPQVLPPAPESALPETAEASPPAEAPAPALPPARPQPGFGGAVDGVRADRLPRIGASPALPEGAAPETAEVSAALVRNARAFSNPDGKPPFAILLLDDPGAPVDLPALAAGDLPITLVIDPTAPDAAARASLWRAAGQEVALLASALPARGRPGDYEVALEALGSAFPQALALVDPATGGLQGDRSAAAALVPALQARGFGLVTWDRGLNAADQVARREGLPAATIFRDLDAAGEAVPVMRRYLDRAAFKAQQDGLAVVIGRLRPETVTALLEWALEGRASQLALAPVSAVLAAR
ncbi:MAG: divergent polysaccharide deacetylase family protein [Gemmobacter sp.]|uniref:divergent polysaccharide deacteylase family protein n=1 Tax=Gemmobacter sp. TaxID=1898957 RepID=UPI0039194AD7